MSQLVLVYVWPQFLPEPLKHAKCINENEQVVSGTGKVDDKASTAYYHSLKLEVVELRVEHCREAV